MRSIDCGIVESALAASTRDSETHDANRARGVKIGHPSPEVKFK